MCVWQEALHLTDNNTEQYIQKQFSRYHQSQKKCFNKMQFSECMIVIECSKSRAKLIKLGFFLNFLQSIMIQLKKERIMIHKTIYCCSLLFGPIYLLTYMGVFDLAFVSTYRQNCWIKPDNWHLGRKRGI